LSYLCPTELAVALDAMRHSKPCVIAGGTDVYPAQQRGVAAHDYLDVTRIHGFRDISAVDGATRIGAAVRWSDIVFADLPPAFDALKQAAREVGSIQIQNAGTIAGNLCNASPAADGVPPLLALNAEVELVSTARGPRTVPLTDFITGVRQTCRAADELVSAIVVPGTPQGMVSAFEKLGSRRYLVISICMTAVNLLLEEQKIVDARVAVGACSAVAQRLPALEAALLGKRPQDVIVSQANLSSLAPIDDVRGTASYRLDAVAEQCLRAIRRAGAA